MASRDCTASIIENPFELSYFKFLQTQKGGDVYGGRNLKRYFQKAGFSEVSTTARGIGWKSKA